MEMQQLSLVTADFYLYNSLNFQNMENVSSRTVEIGADCNFCYVHTNNFCIISRLYEVINSGW